MNKENKSKLEALLEKVANEQDLEIYGLNIKTNQNPIVIDITIKRKLNDGYLSNIIVNQKNNSKKLMCRYKFR